MSNLRPEGIPIEINGHEYHFVFTFSVVDTLESATGRSITDIISEIMDGVSVYQNLTDIITALINDEIAYNNYLEKKNEKLFTRQEVAWMLKVPKSSALSRAVFAAYFGSLPEADEDEAPNAQKETEG